MPKLSQVVELSMAKLTGMSGIFRLFPSWWQRVTVVEPGQKIYWLLIIMWFIIPKWNPTHKSLIHSICWACGVCFESVLLKKLRWSESHFKCEHLRLRLYRLWDEHRRTQWRGLVCRYWSSLQISPRYCRDPVEKLGAVTVQTHCQDYIPPWNLT